MTEIAATSTWSTTKGVESSGTRYTKAGPKRKSTNAVAKRFPGVLGLVAADSTPKSSAFDRRPNFSMDERDRPKFSAVERRPAFSAFESNLSCSTRDNSFIASGCSNTLSRIFADLSPSWITFTYGIFNKPKSEPVMHHHRQHSPKVSLADLKQKDHARFQTVLIQLKSVSVENMKRVLQSCVVSLVSQRVSWGKLVLLCHT